MGKHDQSLKGGERGDSGRQGERRCISQRGKGGKQQGAGQARNKNRPLTLSAVTRSAVSKRGERSADSLARNQILFQVSSLSFIRPLFNRLRRIRVLQSHACFFNLPLKSWVIFKCQCRRALVNVTSARAKGFSCVQE